MGIGLLIPWNAFITAADFFASKFPVRPPWLAQVTVAPVTADPVHSCNNSAYEFWTPLLGRCVPRTEIR